jgi:phosphoglycolate phosphatase
MKKDLAGAAILFDLDGTLVDTAEDLTSAMNHALGEAGLSAVPSGAVRGLVGRGGKVMLAHGFALAAGRAPAAAELEEGLDRFLAFYRANIAVHSKPFDGVVGLLESLRARGGAIAICTNKYESLSRLLIERLGISGLFDAIVGADTAHARKPDPAPALLCLEKTGARRGVFIGDSDTDIKTANAARMPCLIAEFGYGPLSLRERVRAFFTDYDAVEDLIDGALEDARGEPWA